MSDFHQHGPVTALPRLVARPIEDLEAQILRLTPKFPVSLVIPMVPSEMTRPALHRILCELSNVTYLHSLVISLNKATLEDYERAVEYFRPYPGNLVARLERVPGVAALLRRAATRRVVGRRARQGPRLLAGDGVPARGGEGRLHGLPRRRHRELRSGDARPSRPARARPDRRFRLRQGVLRALLRPPARAGDTAVRVPVARGLHPPDWRRPVHPLSLVIPVPAVG